MNSCNTYVVGFPKSGNTWLVRLLARSMQKKVAIVPMGGGGVDLAAAVNQDVSDEGAGAIYKIHWTPDTFFKQFPEERKRIVYICRDVRDVFVSAFFYFKYSGDRSNAERKLKLVRNWPLYLKARAAISCYVKEFVDDGVAPFGTWGSHISEWSAYFNRNDVAVVRYEDMLNDPVGSIKNIAEQWRLELDEARIVAAVNEETLEKLKNNSKAMHEYLKAFDEDYYRKFFRKGVAGDWKNYLTRSQERYFRKVWGAQLSEMNYV